MKKLGWFSDLDVVAEDLDVLDRLRDEAGLSLLIPESHRYHTSGFRASAELAAASPLRDWAARPEMAGHRQAHSLGDTAYGVLPGILGGADDGNLLRVLERCRALGIEVWGHLGLWSYGGDVFPEFAAVAAVGDVLEPNWRPYGVGFCPNRPELNAWVAAGAREAARSYAIAGMCVDHARYPAPAALASLTTCVCDWCAAEADRMGYDMEQMVASVRRVWSLLRSFTPQNWRALAAPGASAWEWLRVTEGAGTGWLDFLAFRCRTMADRFGEFRAALHAERGSAFPVGADSFPPSIGYLSGVDYGRWSNASDFLTGGHGPMVAWDGAVNNLARSVSEQLAGSLGGDAAAQAGAAVAALSEPGPADADRDTRLVREWQRLAGVKGATPALPALPTRGTPRQVRARCEAIHAAGFEGAVVSSFPLDSPEALRSLRWLVDS